MLCDRLDPHIFADKLLVGIPQQNARQKPGFTQDLKAVANAEYISAGRREGFYGAHNRGKLRNGARANVIPIRKSARQHDAVIFTETF